MISESSASDHKTDMSLSEWKAMTGAENPVVIRSMLADMTLSPEVSRGLSSVGVMLPTTPLHALLADACRFPLVVTSGNIDGDPLATEVTEAERSLGEIANLFLHHDRPIAHPVDDSVVRLIAGRATTIRLARGLAPLSLAIASSSSGLALGGHQKVAIALSNGAQAVLGPHLGDLDTVSMRNRFEAHVDEMLALYGCSPEFVVVDQHPDYFTSRWIEQFEVPRITVEEAALRREPAIRPMKASPSPRSHLGSVRHLVRVQHHHAHIAAAMIERGWQDREVLGVAFDGTGYGPDGTIWGGEFLLSSLTTYRRVARLRPFALLGGELAIREPWRVALSLVAEVLPTSTLDEACRRFLPPEVAWQAALAAQANRRIAPLTTSAGRLFDGVAALLLQIRRASFEGQPAMLLEDCCDHLERRSYDFSIHPGEVFELDWRPAVEAVVNDLNAGEPPERIAMKFHHGLARGIAMLCEHFPQYPVVLGGGVFQNRLLVEGIADRIPANRLGLPGRIPPNDGGLAAGQLAIATEVISSLRHH
jgi:hydrogenase maturation protein HypF